MKILLFDMDGVLLDPLGYHKALIETVRLVSRSMGFDDFILSDKDIAQFEALGISSEWDSSALCAALLVIDAGQNDQEFRLPTSLSTDLLLQYKRRIELSKLFEALKGQPAELPAALRAQQAIEDIAHKYHVYPKQPSEIIKHSKLIEHSL
jgi:FMN phosphatase YigB (HAD superfamily)